MWAPFHHPHLSLPVIRRSLIEQANDVLTELAKYSAGPVHWLLAPGDYRSQSAYNSALYRLRRQGLVIEDGGAACLRLTKPTPDEPVGARPEREWRRRWNGIWYVLVYDVPEKERVYRNALRGFLRRLRLGCLQQSVWVTPRDIRPEYRDLGIAAGVKGYSFLFEARTVLGRKAWEIVEAAWDQPRLAGLQRQYCVIYAENLRRLRASEVSPVALQRLAREAVLAYAAAFAEDPLLPKPLWPAGYHGPAVVRLHRTLMQEIARRL